MSDNTNGTTEKINMECADVKQQTEETIQSSKELEKTQEYVSNNGVQVNYLNIKFICFNNTIVNSPIERPPTIYLVCLFRMPPRRKQPKVYKI
jgi:hypothetical protein